MYVALFGTVGGRNLRAERFGKSLVKPTRVSPRDDVELRTRTKVASNQSELSIYSLRFKATLACVRDCLAPGVPVVVQ